MNEEKYKDYLELIENFYMSKNFYDTKQDKYTVCNGCSKQKIYIEDGEKRTIILNCGDKGKCGNKIEIVLPKYIYKDKEIALLKEKLEKMIDWDTISQHIKVDEKFLEENKELIEDQVIISKIKETFYETYRKNSVEFINDRYQNIITLQSKCSELREMLKDISLSDDDKKTYRQEYIRIMTGSYKDDDGKLQNDENNINNLYSEIKQQIDTIKEYYIDVEPVIKSRELDIFKLNKKQSKKNKLSLDDFEEGMTVSFKFRGKTYQGVITKIDPNIKKTVVVKVGVKESNIKISILNIISPKSTKVKEVEQEKVEKEEQEEQEEKEEQAEQGEQEEKEEQEEQVEQVEQEEQVEKPVVGMRVKWVKDKKELEGIIEKITNNSYIICCKTNGTKYRVKLDTDLTIIKEKEEEEEEEEPVKEEPVEKEPLQEEPVKEEPVEKEPLQEEPVEKEPVEKEPVEKEPVEEEPVKEKPVEKKKDKLSLKDFSKGMIVSFDYKGKNFTGEVVDLLDGDKKRVVVSIDGKNKNVPPSLLKII